MAKPQQDRLITTIKHHFDFLFDKGYHVGDVQYWHAAFWQVNLECPNLCIKINCDRDYISVLFAPENRNNWFPIGLETLIYYFSKGKHFVGYFEGNPAWGKNKQLERLASLLSQYHDQIAPLFEIDSQGLREEILLAQKEYSERLTESYHHNSAIERKAWKGLHILGLMIRIIGIGFVTYIGWGVSVIFLAEANINMKVIYGLLTFTIVVLVAVFTTRLLNELQK